MSEPGDGSSRLDPAQARRMLGAVSLRPNERILCLGPAGGALPSVAAILVGPTGHIVEADNTASDGTLPYGDAEFDAVAVDVSALGPEQTHLLAEIARVTAPIGRVTFAVPRAADGDTTQVQQLVETAGLRGVVVRPDPGPDAGSAPVEFVTAFPPAPPKPAAATNNTAQIHRPDQASKPAWFARRPLVIGATAALVAAAALGMIWGLADAEPGEDPPGDADILAGDTEPDISRPVATGEATPEPGTFATPDAPDVEGDSPARSESDSGSSAGAPVNRPPMIDDPGLSSNSLTLTIAPTASDPDGDRVMFEAIEVDGNPVDLANLDSGPIEHRFELTDVGYSHVTTVAFVVTDSGGARVREEFTHEIAAITVVTFAARDFAVKRPVDCFAATEEEYLFLDGKITTSGAVTFSDTFSVSINEQLAAGTPIGLRESSRFVGEEPPPVTLGFLRTFAGWTTFSEVTHSRTERGSLSVAGLDPVCSATFTYSITYDVL